MVDGEFEFENLMRAIDTAAQINGKIKHET